MSTAQVTTWRKYTKREKQAYRARQDRRRGFRDNGDGTFTLLSAGWWEMNSRRHRFADNLGSRVPTARVNGDVL